MPFVGTDKAGNSISRDFLYLRDSEVEMGTEGITLGLDRLRELPAGWDVPTDIEQVVVIGKIVYKLGEEPQD